MLDKAYHLNANDEDIVKWKGPELDPINTEKGHFGGQASGAIHWLKEIPSDDFWVVYMAT